MPSGFHLDKVRYKEMGAVIMSVHNLLKTQECGALVRVVTYSSTGVVEPP